MVGFSSVRKVLETLSGRALGVALGAALAEVRGRSGFRQPGLALFASLIDGP